jgi:hypothetical protein
MWRDEVWRARGAAEWLACFPPLPEILGRAAILSKQGILGLAARHGIEEILELAASLKKQGILGLSASLGKQGINGY